jgi:hypothetical protein
MAIFNHTDFPRIEEMTNCSNDALPLLAHGKSNWRQRYIKLFEHPDDPSRLISIGDTFDGEDRIICDELRSDWTKEITMKQPFVTN